MSDRLDPWLAAMIRQERARPDPPPALKTRVLDRIHASLQSPALPTQERPTTEGPGTTSWTALARVSTVVLAFLGAGAFLASRSASTPRGSEVAVVAAAASSGVVAAAIPAAVDPPVAAASPNVNAAKGSVQTVVPTGPAWSATGRLRAERELLDRARTHLLEGEPAAALEALDVHRRRFPHGVLSEERDALQAEALGSAGRTHEACTAARAFQGAYPGSLLGRAVDDACGGAR